MLCNGNMLSRVPCFNLVGNEFIARVANVLRACVFTPSEQVTPGYFYIVHSGVLLCENRIAPRARTPASP